MGMTKTFEVGDVVKLASDGPDMTIHSLPKEGSLRFNNYVCQWFAGKKLEQGTFQKEQLVLVKKRDAV